jgi:AraC family transcriptional regulator
MKLAGAGRILLWSGGSLWIGRTGEQPTEVHSHHAVQISLALSGDGILLRGNEGAWNTYRAAIVAANAEHAFDGGGHFIANVFVEPESREGQLLQQRCIGAGIQAVPDGALASEATALFTAYQSTASNPVLTAAARAVIARLAATTDMPQTTLDPRIKRALELIRARILDESIPLADVADAAHLSPDRFRHLFLAETGIRFRPYVLWLRIEIALAAYAAHSNLTDAAQAGGFADSAHFSRSFKSMFGISPSALKID